MIGCSAGVSSHGRKHVSATNTEGAKAAEVAFGAECQRGLTGDDRAAPQAYHLMEGSM